MPERIDTKAALDGINAAIRGEGKPSAETLLAWWKALAQEIADREALEKLLEEGRAILSNDSIVKIQGDLVGQVVFYSWSERVDAVLATKEKPEKICECGCSLLVPR